MEWVEWQGVGVRGHPKCWVVWYMGRGEEGRLAGVQRGERGQTGRVVKHWAWGWLPQGGEKARVEGYGRSRWMMRSRRCWMVAVCMTWEANVSRAARRRWRCGGRKNGASLIVGDHWGRRRIFGRLVHWNLVHNMLLRWMIRRVHTVVHWRLIDMNRLPVVGRNGRGTGGGDQRRSRGDEEGGECSRGGESRAWMGSGGGKVVRHRGGDVVEVVVVNRRRQCLHLLVRRLVCWLRRCIRSRRVLMFISRWGII